ncbi:MAG: hypothetical protein MI975_26720 [Cytophagales bacterium]|nr:hypothetical protein [Cytophagales bacterium]
MRILNCAFILVALLLFLSCEEEDCAGCYLNPKIKLKFEATGTKQFTDSVFSSIKDEIADLVDSLEGQLSDEAQTAIQNELIRLREDSARFNEDYQLFRVSKAKIDEIEAPGSLGFEQFQDSIVRDFSIPVNMNSDTSTYYFYYHGLTDTLQLYYKRAITQSYEGVRMRLWDIVVNEELSTFDSVRVKCYDRECSNALTHVYLYF